MKTYFWKYGKKISVGMINQNRALEIFSVFFLLELEEVDLISDLANDALLLIVWLLKVWYNDNII